MGFVAPLALGAVGAVLAGASAPKPPQAPRFIPMGEAPPEVPSLPPERPFKEWTDPPTPQELMAYLDQISRVKQVAVKMPDGRVELRLEELPDTPEIAEKNAFLERVFRTTLENIHQAVQRNPQEMESFRPFIQTLGQLDHERVQELGRFGQFASIEPFLQDFRKMNADLYDRDFNLERNRLRDELAHRGLAGGSSSVELEAALANERAMGLRQVDVNSRLLGEDLRNQQLARESNLYGMNERAREQQARTAEMEYMLPMEQRERLMNEYQQGLNNSTGAATLAANLLQQKHANRMGTVAPQMALNATQLANQEDLQRWSTGQQAALDRTAMGANIDLNRWQARTQGLQNQYQQKLARHSGDTSQRMQIGQQEQMAYQSRAPNIGEALGSYVSNWGGRMMGNRYYDSMQNPMARSSMRNWGF